MRSEGRDASAITFMSTKWAGRAPSDTALFRVFFGGYAHPEVRTMSNADLLVAARKELRDVLRIEASPLAEEVFRWNDCRPQPVRGHLARLEDVQRRLAAFGGLSLCGGPYDGVGLPDCVRQANSVVAKLLSGG
jgi:oxygen-dependent protoporphyrinogen oxidase